MDTLPVAELAERLLGSIWEPMTAIKSKGGVKPSIHVDHNGPALKETMNRARARSGLKSVTAVLREVDCIYATFNGYTKKGLPFDETKMDRWFLELCRLAHVDPVSVIQGNPKELPPSTDLQRISEALSEIDRLGISRTVADMIDGVILIHKNRAVAANR